MTTPLSPTTFPVSSRGSWLSLAIRDERHSAKWRPLGSALYLRSHHGTRLRLREFCRVDLLRGRREILYSCELEPGLLRLIPKSGNGRIEILILPTDSVRIRAAGGLGLRLWIPHSHSNTACALSPDRFNLNVRASQQQFMVECLKGAQELDAPWDIHPRHDIRVYLDAGTNGAGEWAIDGYESTWIRPRRKSFIDERRRITASFKEFLDCQLPAPRGFAETRRLAAWTNWSCLVSPSHLFQREAMLMSKGWMDQVWSWDNCFNAMALAKGMPGLAMDQLMTVIDRQDAHGCYPDASNDLYEHFCHNKPPVWGIALREMRRSNPRAFSAAKLRLVLDSVTRFTDWWLKHRRLKGRPLCYYRHGNDSGWDNSTQFDAGVPLEAPDLNAFLALQARECALLAGQLGNGKEALRLNRIADRLVRALLRELWVDGEFVGLRHGEPVRSRSLIPCMPLVLGDALPRDVSTSLVQKVREHITEWGPATEHPDSPLYQQDGYWRGPIWGPSTVIICLGLEAAGEAGLAEDVARRFLKLCRQSGFAENFEALSGAPLRDPSYSWTASAFLFLADRFG